MRLNIDLTGIASDLLVKVPIRKRGQAISCIISHSLSNGQIRSALSSMFNDDEMEVILGKSHFLLQKEEGDAVVTESKTQKQQEAHPLVKEPNKFRVQL